MNGLGSIPLASALLLLAPLGTRAAPAQEAAPEPRAQVLLSELSQASPEEASRIAAELISLGEPAARAALEGIAQAGLVERRARSLVAARAGGAASVDAARVALTDPDLEVRANLVALLARPDLGAELAGARVDALEALALADLEPELRSAAVEGLARIDAPESSAALERLLRALAPAERALAAAALSAQPRARGKVLDLVQRAFAARGPADPSGARPLPEDSLVELIARGYGPALAESAGGGDAPLDLAPLVQGSRHPSPQIRGAARLAIEGFVGRLRYLGELERADRALAALARAGLDPLGLLARRAALALQTGNGEKALELARELAARTRAQDEIDGRRRAASAALLEAAALFALERPDESQAALDRAAALLDGLERERMDLRSERLAGEHALALEAHATVELYRILCALELGGEPQDAALLERARAAHELALRAQLARVGGRFPPPASESLDQLFANPLGPSALLFAGPREGALAPERSAKLEEGLGTVLATVAPLELPGFPRAEPDTARLRDPIEDPQRFNLLRRIQSAQIESVQERIAELRSGTARGVEPERALSELTLWSAVLNDMQRSRQRDPESDFVSLKRLRSPSDAALGLALTLREEGRSAAAREIALRVRADLDRLDARLRSTPVELLAARADELVGSSWMDEAKPEEAERVLLASLERLEAIERDLEERQAAQGVALLRGQRSSVLVALAVNSNVKLRRPERALEYFERAYELRRDDFMRVLLACYRARAGRADDARAVLREVPPSPVNYYNLACTDALLGDADTALDYLRLDFTTNHKSPAALERQKTWARSDPDLDSLREDARFRRLVEP
ncbi:MAG TPA: hypothetical protein VMS76_09895 [Planctomycetota bacterium]|nr:hypothetical protein [Planctomycetota bacterium]